MTAHAVRARYVTNACRHTKPGPVMLADYLAGFKARGQGAWPKQKTMAARFGVSPRTIQRWLKVLVSADLLTVQGSKPHHDHITGWWKRKSNRYFVHFTKMKRGEMRRKDQLTPRRQKCDVIALFEEPCSGPAPEQVVCPPSAPPEPAAQPPWAGTGLTAAQWTRQRLGRH